VELDSLVRKELAYQTRPKVPAFSPRVTALWIDALARPESEIKHQVAQDIVKAHRLGMPDLEQAIPSLVTILSADEVTRTVAFDTAHALIELNARDSAGLLMQRAQQGNLSMAFLIEPALADWDFAPMREVWLTRLLQNDIEQARLALAIDGLRVVNEQQAIEPLRRLALDSQNPSDLRLKSARALGSIRRAAGESDARDLFLALQAATLINRLVAAELLRYHSGPAAVELLLKLTRDRSGPVAAIALARLVEIDPSLVEPVNEQIVTSPDANVRQLAAQAFSGQQTVEAVALLGILLDDPIPNIRIFAADQLVALDKIEPLRSSVRAAATKMLFSERPRGVKQAAMVLGAIDHEPAAGQLVQLLESDVPEIAIASAWALRKLAVVETAEAILQKVHHEIERTLALDNKLWQTWSDMPTPVVDFDELLTTYLQLEQLIQALAVMRIESSEPLLKRFLPTPPARGLGDPPAVAATYISQTRAAAIWALGNLSADKANGELAGRLIKILESVPPGSIFEAPQTRAAAAVGLGLMNVQEAIPLFRKYIGAMAAHDTVGATCARSLHKLAGDPLPKPVPLEVRSHTWFLTPLE
jgi:HEAT repeat protein